ncbi:MAG TPA: histidine phosphatase family protein [Clostridium sp.]|jgi:probable phosphoglycerate mutase|uniref:Histidine phosphatase family protein n=1 Tax=Clostridium lapidicellarium TaxID=3240931 RepID=A0ABV4E043_9CLOT|nr:histidine phosphatase family protein [Clostridium sp.]
MVKLYITRHGETVWNTEKRMQGRKDSPLTEEGIRQANLLKKRLKSIDFSVVYSSPSGRALRTAKILVESRNIPIIKDDRLMEIDLGKWEGFNQKEIGKKNPEQLHNFWTSPDVYEPEGGEKFEHVKDRVVPLIKGIINKCDGKNVLIVTHAVTLKVIMAYFENTPLEELWHTPYIHQTSLSQVNIQNGQATVILHGDSSHLGKVNKVETV